MKTIATNAFAYCTMLESVDIKNGVTSIGGAFYGCTSLKSIVIPDSVTDLSSSLAFSGCTSLESVTLPKAIKRIGGFNGCESLERISFSGSETTPGVLVIPEGVTGIEYQAFMGCTKLTSVVIPASVRTISEKAFYQCANLSSVTIDAPKNPDTWYQGVSIYDNAFTACASSLVFHTICDTAATKWVKENTSYTVEPTEHVRETVKGKASTCKQKGLSDYDRCAYCYYEFTQ